MRKIHYKVILDVFVHENEGADVQSDLSCGDFDPLTDGDGDDYDIMDVVVESVEVSDSR